MFKCKVVTSFRSTSDIENDINAFFASEQPSEIISVTQGQSLDEDDDVCRTVTIIYKEKSTQQD